MALSLAAGCVSQKKYQELENRHSACVSDKKKCAAELDGSRTDALAKHRLNQDLQTKIDALRDSIATLRNQQATLQSRYADLLKELETVQSGSKQEIRKLMAELQANREELDKREGDLAAAERVLGERTAAVDKLERYAEQQHERLVAFERILREKDSTANALRQKVSDALLNFADKGLTVQLRGGKVYVSMDEKLLFASGSFVVDKQGAAALKNIAEILEKNPDISVLIEGHTDDVPYAGSGQLQDNWDLSCKRATSVVRILLKGTAIDPLRITAAGRSEYVPLRTEKTPEARSANRRIEVVLSPKLDEVLKILEN
jgi:chemotaxis protein MotB